MRPETEERPFRILKVLLIETRGTGRFFSPFLVEKVDDQFRPQTHHCSPPHTPLSHAVRVILRA